MEGNVLGELGIIMNFNDHTVTWDTETIPMKDGDTELYSEQRPKLRLI
jgi:hypothetical protein